MYDIKYSLEIEGNNGLNIKPSAEGNLKVLFVPNIRFGREIVELAQRTDILFDAVTIDRNWDLNKWGIGDFYDKRGGVWDFKLTYQNLEDKLMSSESFDVIVIPGINGWCHFSDKIKNAIEKG